MLYEYRRYTVKPGQMDQLHDLMTTYVIRVLRAAGTTEVGYWTGTQGDELGFDYVLAYDDVDARGRAWDALGADSAWQATKEALGDDAPWGAITSTLLTPTTYSPVQ